MSDDNTLTVYLAGDFFDHKDLIGNALLAYYIERASSGRYECVLPQDEGQIGKPRQFVRNQDLKLVMEADLGLFTFDGADLDSGTVVEFMFAKQLDIPAVVLRTDIRDAGDQDRDGDKWNLMCSYYPRTEIIAINGLIAYQRACEENLRLSDLMEAFYTDLASQVVAGLDRVSKTTPLADDPTLMESLYQWALDFPAGGLAGFVNDEAWTSKVLKEKRQKGLVV